MGHTAVLMPEPVRHCTSWARAQTSYLDMSNEELTAACQSGDQIAFQWLVKKHQRSVYALLYQLAPDWQDISDLTQEVFIRVWRSIGTLRNPRAFRKWLNQIVTNLFYDELRMRSKHSFVSIDDPIAIDNDDEFACRQIPDPGALPDELVQRHELSDIIHRAIAKLKPHSRTMLVLRDLQGLSYKEIAELTKTEIGTVKSRIARARVRMQSMILPYMSETVVRQ